VSFAELRLSLPVTSEPRTDDAMGPTNQGYQQTISNRERQTL
jgi:hypothetical protein